mmetsp:Transcript_23904/g.39535  ORF Transcript_23904/g.39535 Transcript_23904/m.39535 type:complete len:312 (+) Transcript_23904:54-989(+)|eukprot:CAMPEP_0119311098 /NCGR_PEP_ID=MMETSP1333-20130426/21663_1 /TAXON_ID=418940 /ORGANISM="Scyphosphaera apsteinii, Strain RCC1455" /LENGTH=311 /DNA_ID=CAMNT_0007315403 /DNA_START=53 /DNA_END=988 /DNA_ORIENTATION=+
MLPGTELTLGDRLAIALVPSSVPAIVILAALGCALVIGDLPDFYEEIAGGALLITYIKELFPKVAEQGETAVQYLLKGKSLSVIQCKIAATSVTVACVTLAVIGQDGLNGFPGEFFGMASTEVPEAQPQTYTPTMTVNYFVGFFVDGLTLAYDDVPISCDKSLFKKMIMSLVFSIDNFLDGFGLTPVYHKAFGDDWLLFFVGNAVSVLAGALSTALVLHLVPSPVVQLGWLSFATTFVLLGAIQLMPNGMNTHVMIGVVVVWVVLFAGDLTDEGEEPKPTLKSGKHSKFLKVVQTTVAADMLLEKLHPSTA